jgi:hypothetical protein
VQYTDGALAEGTYVSELEEGALVEATFAVQRKRRRRTRSGDPFLSLELADRTGRVGAVVWNDVNVLGERFAEGDTVRVLGRVERYDGRPQIAIRDVRRLDQGDALELVPGARRDAETLDGMLEFLAAEIHDPGLSALVGRFLDDGRFRERLRPNSTTPMRAGCSSTRWPWHRCAGRRPSCIRGCSPMSCSRRPSCTMPAGRRASARA